MSPTDSIINNLCYQARSSIIDQQMAATILKNGKTVSKLCCNIQRNTCRGAFFGSLHAEAHAILNYFGKSLSFDQKNGWYFKPSKWKSKKET